MELNNKSKDKKVEIDYDETSSVDTIPSIIEEDGYYHMPIHSQNLLINRKTSYKKSSFLVGNEQVKIENLIEILKKKPKDRTQNEFFLISRQLETTVLYQNLKKSIIEESSLNKILFALANNLEIEKLPKNKIVFKIGETGERFYIILSGKVSILRPKEIEYELTPQQYFIKLAFLNKNKEFYLLNKTIAKNYHTYPIDYKEINIINDIIFRKRYQKLIGFKPSITEFKKLFKDFNKDPLRECNLDFNELAIKESFNIDFEKDFEEKLLQGLNLLDVKTKNLSNDSNSHVYTYIEHSKDFKKVIIFENEYFFTLNAGQNFGDLALDSVTRSRNATVIGEADMTYLGVIKKNIYEEFVLNEKERIKTREIQFLIENYFFRPVKIKTFVKKFFKDFIYEEALRDTIIFKEKDAMDYIYFIKEGEVEIYVNKTIVEIQKFIRGLSILNRDMIVGDYTSDNDPRSFASNLAQNQKLRLFFYGSKEVLGCEEYHYNMPRLYTAKVSSEKLKYYKLDRNLLTVIIRDDPNILDYLQDMACVRIHKLVNRYIEIINYKIKMYDDDISHSILTKKLKNERINSYNQKQLIQLQDINIKSQKLNVSFDEDKYKLKKYTVGNSYNKVGNIINNNTSNISYIENDKSKIYITESNMNNLNTDPNQKNALNKSNRSIHNIHNSIKTTENSLLENKIIIPRKHNTKYLIQEEESPIKRKVSEHNIYDEKVPPKNPVEDLILKQLKDHIKDFYKKKRQISMSGSILELEDKKQLNKDRRGSSHSNQKEKKKIDPIKYETVLTSDNKEVLQTKTYKTCIDNLNYNINYVISGRRKLAKVVYKSKKKYNQIFEKIHLNDHEVLKNNVLRTEVGIKEAKYSFPNRNSNHLTKIVNKAFIAKYKKVINENDTLPEILKKLNN